MRLRAGELACAAGALGLFALLFSDWQGGASGWASLWLGSLVLVVAALLAAGLLVAVVATRRSVAVQEIAAVFAVYLGFGGLIALTTDVLVGDGSPRWPAYAAIAVAALLLGGAWRSMADERLDAPESAFTPPDARPLPKP